MSKGTIHKATAFTYIATFVLCVSHSFADDGQVRHDADPLPSWRESASKTRITEFVNAVTDADSNDYVDPEDRIAVFDNDGTLWAESPAYFQVFFALDVAKSQLKNDPSLAAQSPYREIASGGLGELLKHGAEGLTGLIDATHSNVSEAEFAQRVSTWLSNDVHPTSKRPYGEMTYQPMRELLVYLRANGFSTWIVSGGGVSFMRVWAEDAYGIPPEQTIGSAMNLRYELVDDVPRLIRDPGFAHVNDGPGKPVGIQRAIGKRPILAVGNSDGDYEMINWTTAGSGRRLGVFIHHTDETREWAYDRESPIGKLSRGLDDAKSKGWTIVDMKADWGQVFSTKTPYTSNKEVK